MRDFTEGHDRGVENPANALAHVVDNPPLTRTSGKASGAARACAIALGFSIPISVAADNILLGFILLLWLFSAAYREKSALVAGNRVAYAAILMFGLLVAGLAWCDDLRSGLHMLGKYIDLAFIPIFITLFQSERSRKHAAIALSAALILTLVLSYLVWLGIVPTGFLAIGNPVEPEVFKKYLTQNILMAFGAYLFAVLARDAQSRSARLLWIFACELAILNILVLTGGRSGQVILFVLAVYFVHTVWHWKGTAVATGLLALFVLAVALGLTPENSRLNLVVQEIKSWQPGATSHTNTGQRLEYFQNSLAIIRDYPVFGVGTGGFRSAYARQVATFNMPVTSTYYRFKDIAEQVWALQIPATENPHNEFLNIAVQLGVFGLGALLWLFYVPWQMAPALPTATERDLARGIVITFVVGCLLNSLLMDHVEGLFFAWVIGVLFGGLRPAGKMRLS